MKKSLIKSLLLSLGLLSVISCKILVNENENIIYTDKSPENSSMGYKTLKAGQSFDSQVSGSNYIYIVDSTFDLNNTSVSVGSGSILKFTKNGSIKNGTITFNNTFLDGNVNFKNTSFAGNLLNKTVNLSWFGVNKDRTEEKAAVRKNSVIIAEVLDCMGDTLIVDGFYPVSSIISITKSINLRSPDWNENLCTRTYDNPYEPSNGFYSTDGNNSIFKFYQYQDENGKDKVKGSMNMFGIYLKGNPEKYLNATSYETDDSQLTCGVFLPWGGSLAAVYNCKFEGFTQGIRSLGGYIEKLQNTTFNACELGFYAIYASDFEVFSCKFTNCMPNYKFTKLPDVSSLRQIGCGFMIEGCGMVNCANCLFKNNFINLIINEVAIIINISNCDFINPVFNDIYVYNDYTYVRGPFYFTTGYEDNHRICIDNVVITENNFTRNKNALGKSIVMFTNGFHSLYNHGFIESDRITNLIFANNKITDARVVVPEDEALFIVSNKKETQSKINCNNNNFASSKANYFASLMDDSYGKFTFVNSENKYPSNVSESKINNNSSNVIVCE
ncbi:MAG: hypothetical protein IKX23_00500 [Treponema sp.]|nr:hypothetical protein [Treponema sp.]